MKIIDLHQDLLSHIRFREKFDQTHQTDFLMIEESSIDTVIATAFPLPEDNNQFSSIVPSLIEEELKLYVDFCDDNKTTWTIIKKGRDFDVSQKKILLHIEGLNVFSGFEQDWELLNKWHSMGLRSLATHWNLNNSLGGGTLDTEAPLTSLGADVIEWAEDKKIILDFAHMGRRTFEDARKLVSRPLYVSHGNADTVCKDIRNYTDEQLKYIAESGGIIGVFFPNTFVVGKGMSGSIDDLICHILFIKNLIGIDHIGIGSDFGGIISGTLSELESVRDFVKLQSKLLDKGFTEEEVHKILYVNARRVLTSHLS